MENLFPHSYSFLFGDYGEMLVCKFIRRAKYEIGSFFTELTK